MNPEEPNNEPDEVESLEVQEPNDGSPNVSVTPDSAPPVKHRRPRNPFKGGGGFRGLISRINIYLLGFVLLIAFVGSGGVILYLNSHKNDTATNLKAQQLSTETLKQLQNTDVSVGDSKQILTVRSNAIFGGSVLLKGDVDIAGKLVVGSDLSLTGINVSGNSTMQDLGVSNDLSVGHNVTVNGQVTIQNGLSVKGTTTFAGLSVATLTVSSLSIDGTLNLTHHVVGGGATPSRSSGSALGGGGTASVSGSDTSGSIKINTGSGAGVGCFVTINFTTKYNATPHVVVTPIGSAAGAIAYYINRTTDGFSVCTASNPPDGASFGFDYIVLG